MPFSAGPGRRELRLGALVLSALLASACGSPTSAPPAFDLVDEWVGTIQGQAQLVRIDVEARRGTRLQGSGEALDRVFAMEGHYAPPTVYFRLTAEADTITFVGAMFTENLVSGSLALDRGDGSGGGRIVLARR